jgi:osmotically-inducible protein OsmY
MRRFGVGMAMISIALVAVSWAMADDLEIAREITNKLKTEKDSGRLQHFDINLQVADGTVVLEGHVASKEQQELALNAARRTDGVTQVISQLEVQPKAKLADCDIADKIAEVLSEQKAAGKLRDFRISVEVTEGSVTLEGTVADEGQRRLTRQAALSVSGVQGIVDKLAVKDANSGGIASSRISQGHAEQPVIAPLARQPITDLAVPTSRIASRPEPADNSSGIAALGGVENALYHRDADNIAKRDEQIGTELMKRLQSAKQEGQLKGFGIGVHVVNAEVTLTGRVSSKEQHQMAIDIARRIPGVKKVINDLTITETATGAVAGAANTGGVGADAESMRIAEQLVARLEQQEAMGRLRGCEFDVRVERSEVILSGHVGSAQQERLLLEVAQQVPGVRQVSADLSIAPNPSGGMPVAPVSVQLPAAYSQGQMMADPIADQTPRPIGAGRMAAYAGGAVLAAPVLAMNQMMGGGAPAQLPDPGQAVVPARYDHPNLPGYAWPSYAASPNYAAVTYPKQYSPTAWPYIGPFYPYPQVPLGWRKVTLQWKDGWWQMNFKSK